MEIDYGVGIVQMVEAALMSEWIMNKTVIYDNY